MPKIEIEIPQAEYSIFEDIARKLGLDVETLIQQETDQAIRSACVWLQRA